MKAIYWLAGERLYCIRKEYTMKKRTKRSVYVGVAAAVLMIILLVYSIKMVSQASIMAAWDDDEKPKVIYVVYDNSTSMVRDDLSDNKGEKEYTTRWVEASYAIKALATMMNDEDVLRIYPISGSGKLDEIKFKNNTLDNVLKKIDSEMNSLKWETGTLFSSVENAVIDLRSIYDSKYEYWVVILTDGAFIDLEDDPEPLQDKLENLNSGEVGEGKPIHFAYIYISGGSETEIKEKTEVKENMPYILIPDSTEEEITGKITNIANKIYNRVAIKSPEDYIVTEGNNTRIELNIPLERALVFIQNTGEENNYESIKNEIETTYKNMDLDGGIACSGGLKEDHKYTITGDSRLITEASINAKPGDGIKIPKMKYRFIKGNMYVIAPTGAESDFRKQYITVKNYTKDGDSDSIDVYYKPSVKVSASYFQDDQEVIHTQECIDSQGEGQAEKCIPAGELVIQVDILANDDSGEQLTDYELLYPDDFEVSLRQKVGEEWEEVYLDRISRENLQYRCELEKGEYELQVITSWNATYTQKLEIQDRWQPVAMEFYNTDSIYLESVENPSCEVRIRAFSGGDAADEDVLAHVKDIKLYVNENELFEVKELGRRDDIWRFRVTLKDPSIHDVGERLALNAVAETDYQLAQSSEYTNEQTVDLGELSITSGDFTITVKGPTEAGDYWRRLFLGETVGINYICDGIELTEEQRKDIGVLGNCTTDPEKMQKRIRITTNGNIRLEYAPGYWFFRRENTVILRWNVTYTRWNTEKVQEVMVELNISYLSLIAQWAITLTALLSIMWGVLCFFKRFTSSFIHKASVTLVSDYGSQKIRLCRKGMLWLPFPFWKKARIKYRDSSGFFPEIRLDIRNNPEGLGYEILNFDTLSDETKYRLGNKRISEKNRIFSDAKPVQVADRNGIWYKMVMKR